MNNSAPITAAITAGLARRHARERRFQAYGLAALAFAGVMLLVLLVTIIRPGISGFIRHDLRLDIAATAPLATSDARYSAMKTSLTQAVEVDTSDRAVRLKLISMVGFFAADAVRAPGTVWVPVSDPVEQLLKGRIDPKVAAHLRPLDDQQLAWVQQWQKEGRIRTRFNHEFFTTGDSRAPEAAGFGGSVVGSLLVVGICLLLAVPIAIMAAITLEEFARKNRLAEMLEIVINNLAAVPSIIYGLLGLAIFLQLFGMPRSSPLVGGLTLAVLILPVLIISARAAIRAVPPSMRQAATALGATRLQVVRHHVLPYAMPGVMTGIILSICRALGESAPLLMIGMVAFVADVPRGPLDPATAMPVEIYLWASSPELGFVEKTSAGIMVLLVILLLLNMAAIKLRNRSQQVWN